MYKLNVQHYGSDKQVIDTFKRRDVAERSLQQQAHIVQGYEKRTGFVDGQFIVFGDDDTFKTRMWISK